MRFPKSTNAMGRSNGDPFGPKCEPSSSLYTIRENFLKIYNYINGKFRLVPNIPVQNGLCLIFYVLI